MKVMPQDRFNFRLLFVSIVSMLDDAVILTLLLIILSRLGVQIPLWLIIFVIVLFIGWVLVSYFAISKNPQLGFENMIGATGVTLDSLLPRGTIRIGHENWAAKAHGGNIGVGVTVLVVGQSGLLLTVVREDQTVNTESKR